MKVILTVAIILVRQTLKYFSVYSHSSASLDMHHFFVFLTFIVYNFFYLICSMILPTFNLLPNFFLNFLFLCRNKMTLYLRAKLGVKENNSCVCI